ncbi:MAG: CDP-diacylglycerol--glycerol-3-phosphate 3-phosphatidyltransferase [Christensenellaceae bacterium]|nr:CDP-diacylglycerol--glycerol-3-phosphate 3-phosphatidyltransferase [Christensenellaceae bacterium]
MNIPNKITLARIGLTIVTIVLFLIEFNYSYLLSAIVFTIAAVTDFLDGYIARRFKLVTNVGKFLDPIADKILVICSLILVVVKGVIPAPYGAIAMCIIISRELIIGTFRQIAAASSIVLAADKYGKIKTVLQYIATPLLMISVRENNIVYNEIIYYIALAVLVLSVIMTVFSAINYVIKNKQVLKG